MRAGRAGAHVGSGVTAIQRIEPQRNDGNDEREFCVYDPIPEDVQINVILQLSEVSKTGKAPRRAQSNETGNHEKNE